MKTTIKRTLYKQVRKETWIITKAMERRIETSD